MKKIIYFHNLSTLHAITNYNKNYSKDAYILLANAEQIG